jgi:hypothetical protein
MKESSAIAPPMNPCRAGTFIKRAFYCWSLLWVSTCVWAIRPSVAECAPDPRATASPRLILPSAAGTGKRAMQFGNSVTRNAEGGGLDQRELSALNLLGIRYAKGQGVRRNRALAKRFFLRSAIQGYTPAMANLGTLYGAKKHSDLQRAYAWVRAALLFGVPEDDHDETVIKLWMLAARLRPERIESAEKLADVITTRIVKYCKCSPSQETELASIDFP